MENKNPKEITSHLSGLIIGGGSIGTRHSQNLSELGIRNLSLVEPDKSKWEFFKKMGISLHGSINEAFKQKQDFIVIASPTHLHVAQALEVWEHQIPLFIEKPLAHSIDALNTIAKRTKSTALISLVGCNMRFHPGPKLIKNLLANQSLGKLLFGSFHMGYFLPNWRPSIDYRLSYSAQQKMGGGCLLDCIHEIDLARWLLGDVVDLTARIEKLSELEINTEDLAVILARHQSGAHSQITLDYLQQSYERGIRIVGERGSIFWDFGEKQVRWYDASRATWENFLEPLGWDLNQMYLDEMVHFLDCVAHKKQSVFPIQEAIQVNQIAFAARKASKTRSFVTLESTDENKSVERAA